MMKNLFKLDLLTPSNAKFIKKKDDNLFVDVIPLQIIESSPTGCFFPPCYLEKDNNYEIGIRGACHLTTMDESKETTIYPKIKLVIKNVVDYKSFAASSIGGSGADVNTTPHITTIEIQNITHPLDNTINLTYRFKCPGNGMYQTELNFNHLYPLPSNLKFFLRLYTDCKFPYLWRVNSSYNFNWFRPQLIRTSLHGTTSSIFHTIFEKIYFINFNSEIEKWITFQKELAVFSINVERIGISNEEVQNYTITYNLFLEKKKLLKEEKEIETITLREWIMSETICKLLLLLPESWERIFFFTKSVCFNMKFEEKLFTHLCKSASFFKNIQLWSMNEDIDVTTKMKSSFDGNENFGITQGLVKEVVSRFKTSPVRIQDIIQNVASRSIDKNSISIWNDMVCPGNEKIKHSPTILFVFIVRNPREFYWNDDGSTSSTTTNSSSSSSNSISNRYRLCKLLSLLQNQTWTNWKCIILVTSSSALPTKSWNDTFESDKRIQIQTCRCDTKTVSTEVAEEELTLSKIIMNDDELKYEELHNIYMMSIQDYDSPYLHNVLEKDNTCLSKHLYEHLYNHKNICVSINARENLDVCNQSAIATKEVKIKSFLRDDDFFSIVNLKIIPSNLYYNSKLYKLGFLFIMKEILGFEEIHFKCPVVFGAYCII